MFHVMLFAVVLAISPPQEAPGQADALGKTYEAVRKKAGNDPAALGQAGLACEAHGLTAERVKHLSGAIAIEPASVAAQGLLGLISVWRPMAPAGGNANQSVVRTKSFQDP